ncbi:MAG: hypothetical protein N2747_01605 [Chitinophagaceae bacterium]|nr:hypothetical protein [Chitinophagaceae bacterium]
MKGFEEIHAILKKVSENQLKTDAQIAKLRAAQERIDAQLAKTNAKLPKTDAQLAKTDAQFSKTDAKLKETAKILSNIGINLGQTAEELFYNTFKKKPELAGIKFDEVLRRVYKKSGKLAGEFDLLLVNGDSVALIEIKHKAHPKDITELYTRKLKNVSSTVSTVQAS